MGKAEEREAGAIRAPEVPRSRTAGVNRVVTPAGAALRGELGLFSPLLNRVEAQRAELFGDARARVEPLELIQRRYSELLRIRIEDAAGTRSHAFIKVNRVVDAGTIELARSRQCVEQDFAQHLRAYEAMRATPALTVARPIACFPDALAVVTEEVRREPLQAVVLRALGEGPGNAEFRGAREVMARVGRWLAAFQTIGTGNRVPIERLRTYVDERLRLLVERQRLSPVRRARILARFDGLAPRVSAESLREVPIHGDFSPENILVTASGITVIDFDVAAGPAGTRLHDLAYLYLYLERLGSKPRVSRHAVAELQRALIDGLAPGLDVGEPLFELVLLQHMVAHLVESATVRRAPLRRLYNWYLWRHSMRWLGA